MDTDPPPAEAKTFGPIPPRTAPSDAYVRACELLLTAASDAAFIDQRARDLIDAVETQRAAGGTPLAAFAGPSLRAYLHLAVALQQTTAPVLDAAELAHGAAVAGSASDPSQLPVADVAELVVLCGDMLSVWTRYGRLVDADEPGRWVVAPAQSAATVERWSAAVGRVSDQLRQLASTMPPPDTRHGCSGCVHPEHSGSDVCPAAECRCHAGARSCPECYRTCDVEPVSPSFPNPLATCRYPDDCGWTGTLTDTKGPA